MKIPISLIIDDPAPRVFVFYEHSEPGKRFTRDGRPLRDEVPNSFLFDFCDTAERYGLKGKFSVIPMPGGRGDIINGIDGFPYPEIKEWLGAVRVRLDGRFSICPEMLTHARAVDIVSGGLLDIREDDWAVGKTAEELTPYISKAVSMLREAGLPVSGVTSPWYFGIKNETEYVKAISESFRQVCGRNECWYFCRGRRGEPNALPWVALSEGDRRVVSIPATTSDHIWQTMDTTDTSDEYVSKIADLMITADGSKGEVIDVMESGGWPVLIAHWQSLFSNGLGTGLRVLGEVGRRIEKNLAGRVEWMSFEQIMKKVLEEPDRYPAPDFS